MNAPKIPKARLIDARIENPEEDTISVDVKFGRKFYAGIINRRMVKPDL